MPGGGGLMGGGGEIAPLDESPSTSSIRLAGGGGCRGCGETFSSFDLNLASNDSLCT